MAPNISRRIAGAHKLDPFQRYPRLVRRPPESILLDELAEEGDCSLSPVSVGCWKINLVAEDDKPTANLGGGQHNPVECFSVLTILLECFDQQVGCCCT